MSASILQTYLRQGIFDLGSEDDRLVKLSTAAVGLSSKYAKTPIDVLPVFFEALRFDGEAGKAFGAVEQAIEAQWPTFRGAFKDGTAATLYRATALQAVALAIDKQPSLGIAVSLLCRNLLPYLDVGKEKEALDSIVAIADAAYHLGVLESYPDQETFNITSPKFADSIRSNRATLLKAVQASVGPTTREGQPSGKNPNPHWPNQPDTWAHEFADRLTGTLADHFDWILKSTIDANGKNYVAAAASLKEAAENVYPDLRQSTNLLWWRQALYSSTAEKPYRALTPAQIVIHTALDLAKLVPVSYQRALESFLTEAIFALIAEANEAATAEWMISSGSAASVLKEDADLPAELLLGKIAGGKLVSGFSDVSLRHHEWAVWLLRERKALDALRDPLPIEDEEEAS
jgi:GTPase-associated system helical domain